jgi:hypothetical protein
MQSAGNKPSQVQPFTRSLKHWKLIIQKNTQKLVQHRIKEQQYELTKRRENKQRTINKTLPKRNLFKVWIVNLGMRIFI